MTLNILCYPPTLVLKKIFIYYTRKTQGLLFILLVCWALCRKINKEIRRIKMREYLNSDVTQIEVNDDYHTAPERLSLVENEYI